MGRELAETTSQEHAMAWVQAIAKAVREGFIVGVEPIIAEEAKRTETKHEQGALW